MQIENWKEIGKSYIELTEHIRTNLIYPELNNEADRFWTVQLELVLSPDGRIKTLKPHTPDLNLRVKVHPTTRRDFINNAKKVIHSFEGWVPDLINHEYQLTKRIKTVTFNYHKLTLIDQSIILNPEVRAQVLDKDDYYKRTVHGINGCDGIGEIIAIINEEGLILDMECISSIGKTNQNIIMEATRKLGKWNPAFHLGKPVKSQVYLKIFT